MKIFSIILVSAWLITSSAFADEGIDVRKECRGKDSHVAMRACLKNKAKESADELRNAEGEMRSKLAAWDEDSESIKRSLAAFKNSIEQFIHFRTHQCEFIASLAAGGNGQGDLRLSCIYEMNKKRIDQIKQDEVLGTLSMNAGLPPK